jgi:hypothetical protein
MTLPLPPTDFEFRDGNVGPGGEATIDEESHEGQPVRRRKSEDTPVRKRNEMPPAILDISDETKARLTTWLDTWLLDLESSLSDRWDDWAKQEDSYRALTPDTMQFEPFRGACRDVIPVGAMAVDPIHARLDVGVFKQDPVFSFKGLRRDLVELMPYVQAFVDKYQKNYLRLRQVSSPRLLECTKLGTCAFKTVYDRDEYPVLKYSDDFKEVKEVKQVRFAGPRVFGIHIGDLLFPPFYETPNECPIIFERQRTTYEALKILEAAGKLANVDAIRNQQTLGTRTKVEEARERANKHSLRTTFANELIVYEVWCDFALKEGSVPDRLILTYHRETRTFLQLRLNWYFHQKKPYTIIPYTVSNDTMLGLGIMEMVRPLQDAITKWHRMAQDNAYIANIRMFIAKRNSGIEQVPRLYGGRVFFVDDPTKDFIPFASGDIYPSTLAERQNLFGMVEKRTGVSDYLQGRESPIIGTRATATSTLALIKEGTQRVEEVLENIRQGFAEIMEYCISIWIQYGTGGLEDLLFDDDAISKGVKQFFSMVNHENINGAFAVDLTVTDASSNRQAQQQMKLALTQVMMMYLEKLLMAAQGALQAMQAGMPQYAEMVKEVMSAGRHLLFEVAQTFDVRNPEDILPDLEKILDASIKQIPPAAGPSVGGGTEGRNGGPAGQQSIPVGAGPARGPNLPSPARPGSGGGHPVLTEAAGAG